MTKTEHYQLNQWEAADQVRRTDFNADNAKIEAALAAKTDNSAFTQLQAANALKANTSTVNSQFSTVNSRLSSLEGRVEVVIGSYTGDGTETRTISLGFTPKAVLVEDSGGMRVANGGSRHGGLALSGAPVQAVGGNIALQVVTGGFEVYYIPGYVDTNSNNVLYRYLAFKQVD